MWSEGGPSNLELRSNEPMNVIVKRVGIFAGGLAGVLAVTAAGVVVGSNRVIARKYTIAPETVPIPTDTMSITRGKHLARAITKCVDCHGDNLGGRVLVENGAMGRWVVANITRGKGGVAGSLTDADIVRAVRHAVAPDGRKLLQMPADSYQYLNAEDLGEIIAYVRSVPPVDNELPPTSIGLVARGLILANKLPIYRADLITHTQPIPAATPVGPTPEYGKYIASVGGCIGCHGPTLSGGKIADGDPAWPPAANLTPTGLAKYTEADFTTVLRTGKRQSGVQANDAMPWRMTREMTDDEIKAVWLFLKTVPPREFGAR